MSTWAITAILALSLVLVVGIQSNAFADSEDGSYECPLSAEKNSYKKDKSDYSENHQSNEFTGTSLEEQQLPSWLKSNAKWWASGQLNDKEFATGIQFLIDQDVITIESDKTTPMATSDIQTPYWIKNTAGWWADGLVSDSEFVSGLEHLVNNGVI